MRKIFYVFAVLSALIFIYSAIHLAQQFSHPVLPFIGDLKGFEDNNNSGEYRELIDKFKNKIASYTDEAKKDHQWYFWMGFIKTALTAASTLVSSIQAAKKENANPGRTMIFMIVIAVLT